MNYGNQSIVKSLVAAVLIAFSSVAINGELPKKEVLGLYETNGFQCMDISEIAHEDTLKSYTDLKSLDQSDKIHVCVKTDMKQHQIPGNKFVFIFDKTGSLKTMNQIASIFD